MKNVFQLAILVSLVLFSCTDEADITENVTGVVGFHATDVASSRAGILDTDILKGTGFRVNAYATRESNWDVAGSTTTPGFMHDQLVTWNTSTNAWTYGPPAKYWPGKVDGTQYGKVSFFAWNEGTGAMVSGNDKTGAPQLTYTVPNAQDDQKDLVTAMAPNLTADSYSGAVPLTFGHVLSRIGFTARLDQHYDATVTITSLKVKYKTDAVRKTGVYTFGSGWALTGTDCMSHTGGGDELVGPAGVPLNNDETPTKTYLTSADAENYLMLLPQTVEAGAVTIDVEWTFDDNGGGDDEYSETIYLPKQTWESGKRYDYNLTVSLTEIKLDMTISAEEWEKENGVHHPCMVTFKANGGTGADIIQPWLTGVKYHLQEDDDTFTPPQGYILGGWNMQADGNGANYQPLDLFTCEDNTTLYAKWVKAEMHDDSALSNCYMVGVDKEKSFPVLRAYAHNGVRFTGTLHTGGTYNGEFEAAVVWDDAGVIDEVEVEKSGKDAVVKVKTTNTSPNGGNAVVKIYKKDDGTATPVWSYHIWVTDYVPEVGVNTWTNPNSTSFTFMNRNLGATAYNLEDAPKTYGLLYQWGRKDPFPGSCEGSAGWPSGGIDPGFEGLGTGGTILTGTNANGIISSIKNPQCFYLSNPTNFNWLPAIDDNLWNQATTNQKTIYDPCPSGWRVPRFLDDTFDADHSPWKGYASTESEKKWGSWASGDYTGGVTFRFASSKDTNAQYPAAGYHEGNSGSAGQTGIYGFYWTASPESTYYATHMYFGYNGDFHVTGRNSRSLGWSVRCVQE